MVRVMKNDVRDLLENQGLIPIGFDAVQVLAELSISGDAIPYLPVVMPVVQFLSQLEVRSESIPRRRELPDIQRIL